MVKRSSSPSRAALDGDDSAKAVLKSLAEDRGKILTETEYREMRDAVLEELAAGPKLAASTLTTFGVVGVILFGFFLVGVFVWIEHGWSDWLLMASSLFCLGLWAYVLRNYVRGVRQISRISMQERLAELRELEETGLISREEFERIYASVHMNRGVPEHPGL